jgi:hypothetical protein
MADPSTRLRTTTQREIRPYRGVEEIQRLFDNVVLVYGQDEIDSDGYSSISPSTYLNDSVSLRLVQNPESDDANEPIPFATTFEKLLPGTGLVANEVQFLVIASTSYLKIVEVLWRGGIDDVRESGKSIKLPREPRPGPFQTPFGGCTVTFVAVLNQKRDAPVLEPKRKGTWLARSQFTVETELGEIGFTPIPLTNDDRTRLGLPIGAMRYVVVGDPLDPEVSQEDVAVWVDAELLGACIANPGTPGSRSFQHQLLLTVITTIVTKASRQLQGGGGGTEISEIDGSIIYRIIKRASGKPKPSAQETQRLLELIRDDPDKFLTYVEDWINNLARDLRLSISGAPS